MEKTVGFPMVVLLASMALPANAQLKFGIKEGVNISSVHFNSDVLKVDSVTGLQVGPIIETTLPLVGVGIDAAALYSQEGPETISVGGVKTSMKTDYIDVPVNLKWKSGLPIVKAYLVVGPYIGSCIGGDKLRDIPSSVVDQAGVKNFSAGLNFDAGVELISHLQVGLSCGLGLTDSYSIEKVSLSDGAGKNRGWSIMAMILF